MQYAYIHFFNIQYWYCVFVSLLGKHCTYTDIGVTVGNATTTAATLPVARPGFWSWLFGGSASGAVGATSGSPGIIGTFFGVIFAIIGLIWTLYSVLAYFASFLLILMIATALVGLLVLRAEDEGRYGNLSPAPERAHPRLLRWQALLDNAMSSDPKRWREAILGADALLGELFSTLGYQGATTAEQIRHVPDDAFANVTSAWEAHRIRNFVASPSSHFILTQREAFRVMKLYEQVFREFDFV